MPKTSVILALGFNKEETAELTQVVQSEGYPCEIVNMALNELPQLKKSIRLYQLALIKLANKTSEEQILIGRLNKLSSSLPLILVCNQESDRVELLNTFKQIIDIRSVRPINIIAKSICRELKLQHHQKLFINSREVARNDNKRNLSVLMNSNDGFALIYKGSYLSVNTSYKRIFGIPLDEDLTGQAVNEFDIVKPNSSQQKPNQPSLHISLSFLENDELSSVDVLTRDNQPLTVNLYKTEYLIKGGYCTQVLIHNPGELDTYSSGSAHLRNIDIETGLFNRQFFVEHLNKKFALPATTGNLAILLIDNYKETLERNDFSSARIILQAISKEISDTLGLNDILSRFGNHLFALYSDSYNQHDFINLNRKILKRINQLPIELSGNKEKLSLSIGVSSFSAKTFDSQELIAQAEKSCSSASLQGGKQIAIHGSKSSVKESLAIDQPKKSGQFIQSALNNNRLQAQYQPIINLSSDSTENYAALLRVLDVEGNLLLPGQFIQAAEHSGQVKELDQWMIRNTVKQIKNAEQEGARRCFFHPLSKPSYQDPNFLKFLLRLLSKNEVDSSQFVFQIDMYEAINQPSELKKFIRDLKQSSSCQIALDHVGFSEIDSQILRDYQADYVKIDGALTQKISSSQDSKSTLQSILEVCQHSNIRTIAKSVEDAETMALLWGLGIDGLQGYFLQKPSNHMSYDFSQTA